MERPMHARSSSHRLSDPAPAPRAGPASRIALALQIALAGLFGAAAIGCIVSDAICAEVKARVPVERFRLDNGMTFLLVRRPERPTVTAGWVAHVGSSNERPGMTGISHLFEHMMFKGTHVIGTRNIKRDLEIIDEQEKIQDQIREEEAKMRAALRHGEIDDVLKPENKTERYRELEKKFN